MKFSQVNTNTSPALVDYLMGVTAGNVDYRVTLQNLVNVILKTSLLNNPYKFGVYRVAGTSTSIGLQRANFDTERFDTGGNYDNSTNYRFTAPVSGFYQFNFSVGIATVTPSRLFALYYKNGAEIARGTDIAANCQGAGISAMLQLSAGDYIEAWFYINATGGTYQGNTSYFDGHLVSQI